MVRDPGQALVVDLAPGERLVWSGRCRHVGRLVVRAFPKGFIGLLVVILALLWTTTVARGGHNKWDQGKDVPPYAPHNLRYAAVGGMIGLTVGLSLLSWPLRTWWRARRVIYALTDQRALICGPDDWGRASVQSYRPKALMLMWCDESADGSGDLVFEARKTSLEVWERVGFLAVDGVRDIEALVRTTLRPEEAGARSKVKPAWGDEIDARTTSHARATGVYTLEPNGLLELLVLFAGPLFCWLFVCALVIIVPLIWGTMIATPGTGLLGVGIATFALVACLVGSISHVRFFQRIPVAIALNDDRTVEFRSWFLTTTVRVDDLISIRNRYGHPFVTVEHKGGKLSLFDGFRDLKEFLVAVKRLNPSVEIRGF